MGVFSVALAEMQLTNGDKNAGWRGTNDHRQASRLKGIFLMIEMGGRCYMTTPRALVHLKNSRQWPDGVFRANLGSEVPF